MRIGLDKKIITRLDDERQIKYKINLKKHKIYIKNKK